MGTMDKSTGLATCKNAAPGCPCLPSTSTPGFECGDMQSCEAAAAPVRRCAGKPCAGATSRAAPVMPPSTRRALRAVRSGRVRCATAMARTTRTAPTRVRITLGAACADRPKTPPGFSCGTPQSCEAGGCAGTQIGGTAACRGNYLAARAWRRPRPQASRCGTARSCQDGAAPARR